MYPFSIQRIVGGRQCWRRSWQRFLYGMRLYSYIKSGGKSGKLALCKPKLYPLCQRTFTQDFVYNKAAPETSSYNKNDESDYVSRDVNFYTVKDQHQNGVLSITWSNGEQDSYPYIFLRDNCQCPICYHSPSKQRHVDTVKTIQLDIEPKYTWLSKPDKALHIVWPDEHQSKFTAEWLWDRRFPKTSSDIKARDHLEPILLWGSELKKNIPSVTYEQVLNDEEVLYSWLKSIATFGFCVIKDAPKRSGVLDELGKIFLFSRKTHYGEVFTVKSKPNANNLAYTADYLPLHVDLPFYNYQPGVQMLHCIQQSPGEGGANHFVDGFNIASLLKEQNPEAFKILTTVKFLFNDSGEDIYGRFNKEFERPVIGLDLFGNVDSLSHNNHVRSSFINAPPEIVRKSYAAYYAIYKLMYDPANLVEYKMEPGDIVTFNNKRVLHGRTGYKITSERWLEGIYVDWDEVYSTMRVIRERKQNQE